MVSLADFLLGFTLNLVVALIIVRFIYYPLSRSKAYVFTFIAFNTIIYCALAFMTSVEMSMGVGFGLFAIFTILRYRTDPIPIREMTYLFVLAALPILNFAVFNNGMLPALLLANLLLIALLYWLEIGRGFHYETAKKIRYERIDLIRPENQGLLLADLKERTGLAITRIEVGKLDFLRDTADIILYYEDGSAGSWGLPGNSQSPAIDDDE